MEKPQGQLVKSITLASATILVVSSVIGTGVYKKVAPMSADLLSPDLVLAAWLLAGILSLFGALSNAEIAGMYADSGGEYVYYKRIYGKFMALCSVGLLLRLSKRLLKAPLLTCFRSPLIRS